MARVKRRPVIISPQAKQDIESILEYLKENWPQKVIDNFLLKLDIFYTVVSINPRYAQPLGDTANFKLTARN